MHSALAAPTVAGTPPSYEYKLYKALNSYEYEPVVGRSITIEVKGDAVVNPATVKGDSIMTPPSYDMVTTIPHRKSSSASSPSRSRKNLSGHHQRMIPTGNNSYDYKTKVNKLARELVVFKYNRMTDDIRNLGTGWKRCP
jgi:hypothetical protein